VEQHKKIKILFLHANNKDIGGADYCMFKLADQLDKDRFTPVVCLSMKTGILEFYEKACIKTYLVNMERIRKSNDPFYLIKLLYKFIPTIFRIRKIIKKEQVHIVHGNDLLDIYGPIAGRLLKIPVVQHVRWILISTSIFKRVIPNLIYILNNKIIAVSNSVAREMFSNNNHIKPNIETCYDWIDMEKVGHTKKWSDIRNEFNISKETPLIGVIGRLDPWKGQEVFIRAASIVIKSFPEAIFFVVGGIVEGRKREFYGAMLKKMTEDLNIRDHVIFTGHREDIYDIMNNLDVFVHSSISPDPLPGVVMEAMFCSKPVVGAKAGGVPEEIINDTTGLLYQPGDYKKMAEAIIYLLQNPDEAKKMGRAGKDRVDRLFNKQNLCSKMESIYEELVCQC